MTNFRNLIVVSAILVSIIAGTVYLAPPAKALGILYFGGRSTIVSYCSGGVLIAVGPPRPGTYLYLVGVSQLKMLYQIYRPGVLVLGMATPGGVCNVPGSPATIPAEGTMIVVGTSLF